ncbi:MAG: transcription-repair coupling factor [Desulfobacterales bacterium]|nr:transcription-repair coupling factor [Desulfobacterales bacterium]MDX2508712.1 transcription-repair coupling factor [Desulfobacterales bacterium]
MNPNQEKISIETLIDKISQRKQAIECTGLEESAKAYLISRVYQKHKGLIFLLAPSQKYAERLLEDLRFFAGNDESGLLYFPPYNILPFKFLSYHSETAAKRIRTLYQLIEGELPSIVVTTVEALLQKIIPRKEITDFAELVMVDEEIERDDLIEKMIFGGYEQTAIVEEPGDFSIRGGIMDIFSPMHPDPLRIEFFGDTVDSIRSFSAASQRKIKNLREAVILPAREAVLIKERIPLIISRIRQRASQLDIPVTSVRKIISRIKNEGLFPGVESLIPMIYSSLDSVFDYLPDNTLFIQTEPEELEKAAVELQTQIFKNFTLARSEDRLCVEPESLYLKWEDLTGTLLKKKPVTLRMLPILREQKDKKQRPLQYKLSTHDNSDLSLALKTHVEKERLLLPLAQWINDNKQSGLNTLIVCHSAPQADRLISLLAPYNIKPEKIDRFSDITQGKGFEFICLGRISSGFVWPDESLAVITENEIFGVKRHKRLKQKKSVHAKLIAFEDLKKKDLVVHVEHGIGRYEGLIKLKINGSTNDFLLIIYKDSDKLYLPVDRMNMVQKYMGVDGIEPVLDKMGGKSWARVKDSVKRTAEKIAGELLKLYAARKIEKGFAFEAIESSLSDFEAGFSYEETQDQLNAIDDVLSDMEKTTPMDRLICGDVGYGKTEVALRASFMAVFNGKQVAVLVPTTVLAQQHFETFSLRFERYPVNVACLSRFRSLKEQRSIISDLKAGKIDIVIGTHRLFSKDVMFKDLGLLVLDEEQRFGVKHKEKLKKIRHNVDVLALTATPIPRTLHLSLMGIRDISVISTPPEYRRAIITYISEIDDAIISEAVRKELGRGGQIYFVHNNIHSIWKIAGKLKKLIPEVRLDVAHGRMDENELERVMLMFMNKEIDMLVCTTIIESGLDIPSANTIIVNRADRFGLAQIYQLRGRVGRADEQAYAYLFIPDETTLGKDAIKRLKVLMEHSDLGAGFQIAMSDLKIRGGGTILGASQSGHIAAVGYEMYLKLMENAVSELKGKPVIESLEPEINIIISAYIPESYITDIDQRLSAYRRLTKMTELSEIADFKTEVIDRFGALPREAANLLLKIMLKVLSVKAGVKRLDLTGGKLVLHFSAVHQENPPGIVDVVVSNKKLYELSPDYIFKARLSNSSFNGLVAQVRKILKEIAQRVNN